jgi:hypothetical protein
MSRVCKEVKSNFFNESFNKDQKKGKKRIFIFFSKLNNFEQKKEKKLKDLVSKNAPLPGALTHTRMTFKITTLNICPSTGRLDTQQNDIQNNDTQHTPSIGRLDTQQNDIQNNDTQHMPLYRAA